MKMHKTSARSHANISYHLQNVYVSKTDFFYLSLSLRGSSQHVAQYSKLSPFAQASAMHVDFIDTTTNLFS